ncbi:MAG: WYL domain-containing protein [Planctomycetes bacterium]|nr:WYL domain-containing protein [Planctomycetota bacterium]
MTRLAFSSSVAGAFAVPADYSRIHRLLRILTLIQSDGDWTAQRLAQTCSVTVRTIYRDMKMLEGAGIPYFFDTRTNGYRVRRDFFMPPVSLTLDESLALIALGEHVGDKEQIPLTRAAGRAITKIRSQLPAAMRDELERLDGHIDIRLARAGPHEGIADVYEQMRAAIAGGRILRCQYDSIDGTRRGRRGETSFDFSPYTLFFSQRAWYVLGHHAGRRAVRCLKLNRFSAVQPTARSFKIPRTFSVDRHLGDAWRMIRGSESYGVELRFDAAFAETIADTHWHHTQEIEWHADQSITFRCCVDGLDEIVWWILSMGPHCVVIEPVELADRVRDLAQGMVDAYAPRSKPSRRKSKR